MRANGDRAKSAKEVQLGMKIQITNKEFEMVIEATDLSNFVRGAPEATMLYKETKESKAKSDNLKAINAAEHALTERGAERPNKRHTKFTGIKNFDGL